MFIKKPIKKGLGASNVAANYSASVAPSPTTRQTMIGGPTPMFVAATLGRGQEMIFGTFVSES